MWRSVVVVWGVYLLHCLPLPLAATCMDGTLRLLVGTGTNYYLGTNQYDSSFYSKPGMDGLLRGRVELCMNGSFGQVCDRNWTNQDASVACRGLGWSSYGQ